MRSLRNRSKLTVGSVSFPQWEISERRPPEGPRFPQRDEGSSMGIQPTMFKLTQSRAHSPVAISCVSIRLWNSSNLNFLLPRRNKSPLGSLVDPAGLQVLAGFEHARGHPTSKPRPASSESSGDKPMKKTTLALALLAALTGTVRRAGRRRSQGHPAISTTCS